MEKGKQQGGPIGPRPCISQSPDLTLRRTLEVCRSMTRRQATLLLFCRLGRDWDSKKVCIAHL